MVEEGPWEPIEDESDEEEAETESDSEGRGFWDYALVGVVLALVVVAGVVVVSSQSAGTQWSLDVRGELGEHEEPIVVTEDDTVLFDAAVGFAGTANGDVAENVSVTAIGQNGDTLASTCLGTLTNDADHEFQPIQFALDQEPARVVIGATAVRNDSEYLVRGWSSDAGTMGGSSSFVQERSSYIDPASCQP